ncbi:MAG: hypothetical protein AB1894_10200 [Chloroflexota bacterium]
MDQYSYTPTETYEQPAPKKDNKMIIIIVVAIVLLCCCCLIVVGGGGYWLWNNGDQLFGLSSRLSECLLL